MADVKIEDLSLIQKLAGIRKMVEVIRKNKSGFNYKYVPEDEILARVTAGMDKYHVLLYPGIVPQTAEVSPYNYTKIKNAKDGKDTPEKEAPSGLDAMKTGDLDRIVAEKNVRFRMDTKSGTAQKATWLADKEELVLEGNPVLLDGRNSVTGKRIRYFVRENRSEVEGGTGRRVEAVFSSNGQGK